MDSNRKTVILSGSLDENFGKAVCARLAPYSKSYQMKLVGMPTWDAITDFNAPAYSKNGNLLYHPVLYQSGR